MSAKAYIYICYKENQKALLLASKETGLEVNDEKTDFMVISRDHNAGQNQSIQKDNKYFESVEQLKYLGTTLTNQNSFHKN